MKRKKNLNNDCIYIFYPKANNAAALINVVGVMSAAAAVVVVVSGECVYTHTQHNRRSYHYCLRWPFLSEGQQMPSGRTPPANVADSRRTTDAGTNTQRPGVRRPADGRQQKDNADGEQAPRLESVFNTPSEAPIIYS